MGRKLAAILSADAQGYSRLMGDDEAATVHTLTAYREVIASAVARRNGEAVDALTKVLHENPDFLPAYAYLAVLYTEMGQARRAQEAWGQARRLSPDASPSNLRQRMPYRRPADLDRFLTAVANLQ